MFCTQCGTRASGGSRYCSNCGLLLGPANHAEPREVAPGGEPGLSWAGRGPEMLGAAATDDKPLDLDELELATFTQRLGGFAIDLAAAGGLAVALLIVASVIYVVATGIPENDTFTDAQAEEAATIWWALLVPIWFGSTWFFNSKGWTLGKRAMGLRIVGRDGRPPGLGRGLGRTLGAWLSWLPLGLGFLWASWDECGQTWHDKMVETYVVRADSLGGHHEPGTGRSSLH